MRKLLILAFILCFAAPIWAEEIQVESLPCEWGVVAKFAKLNGEEKIHPDGQHLWTWNLSDRTVEGNVYKEMFLYGPKAIVAILMATPAKRQAFAMGYDIAEKRSFVMDLETQSLISMDSDSMCAMLKEHLLFLKENKILKGKDVVVEGGK
jgi:hypothetical protein